ncbi:MAG TPA: hypothetical protein VFO67_05125 [Gemmatimonadales bacterium]|nr:hypothetical protein [Gemmatimonadales bacterium]
MSVDITNLIMGPATLYHGAYAAPEPSDNQVNSTPAASAWTDVGGTTDGSTLTINQEYTELMVDQIVDVPGRRLTKRDIQLATNLAEPTLDNLVIVLNGGTVTTTGGSHEIYEPDQDSSATQPDYIALIIDGFGPDSLRRRIYGRRALSIESVGVAYKKDEQTVFPVTWGMHYVSSTTTPFKVVDALA